MTKSRSNIVRGIAAVCIMGLSLCCCGHNRQSMENAVGNDTTVFVMPDIPQGLTEPEKRAGYLAIHYWDNLNPPLLRAAEDSLTMEQAYVDFLTIIPEVEKTVADKAVYNLLEKSRITKEAYAFVLELATKYLYEADSPLENEEMLLPYLQYAADSARADDYIRMRADFLLERVQKNRPGAKASDFQYITRDNKKRNLWSVKAEKLLLIFYDPECQHCMEIISQIIHDSDISDRLNNGKLKILAIYTEGNENVWEANKNRLPANWSVGKDISGIIDNELYDLKAMPTLYLLDKDKQVLMKDLDITR
ncbi:MAG: DUF5106 domain-containing protein [Parabacteroides merdae]